jgi:formylglycine-generating enzyme required for sulfatase activity
MERSIGLLLTLGSALASLTGSASGADHATIGYPVPHEQTIRGTGWPSHYHLSIGDIVSRLRFAGMNPVSAPVLSGSTYVLDAVKSDGQKVRVAVNATTGNAIAAHSGNGPIKGLHSEGSSRRLGARLQVARADKRSLIRVPEPMPSLPELSSVVQHTTLLESPFDFAFVSPPALNSSAPPTRSIETGKKEISIVKDETTSIVLFAADAHGERSAYEAVTMEPKLVAATDRRFDLFATCIATEPQNRTGFVFLTNPPETIDQISYGDTLQVTGPPCARTVGEEGDEARVTIAIRKTGEVETNLSPPRVQHVIMGSILSPPVIVPLADPTSEIVQDCEYCPQLLNVPGGSISMGSSLEPSEEPTHEVTIAAFALARYPVTVSQWRQCVLAMACSYEPIRGSNYSDTPVHNASFEDAQKYVAWLSEVTKKAYRLPTEAEFEYAARAGAKTNYWWGNQLLDGMANCRQCGEPFNADMPVIAAHFMPNSYGLYGVSGGVAQWVADCWHDNYEGAPHDGSAWVTAGCTNHVLRGGSWMDEPSQLRAASRDHAEGDLHGMGYGLRVARDP